MQTATLTKSDILAHLSRFVSQRSGIDFRNYGDRASFMGDYRPILRAGRDARALIRYVELRDSITADMLLAAFRAYSGRLSVTDKGCDYCAGQYFPTEYRNAACAVLSQAIWDWLRDSHKDGHAIRKAASRELGRGIAGRWFR
jgi:hypothetical protein